MNSDSAWHANRRLVPRWRSLSITIKSGELASPARVTKGAAVAKAATIARGVEDPDFATTRERWHLKPSLVTAAELLEAAIVEGRERDAVDAARRLINVDATAAPLIRSQAARLLIRVGKDDEVPAALRASATADRPRSLIALNMGDPLGWVELAFIQTTSGHSEAALRSMAVALQLAPHNRHVLRSAARLFLHVDKPERALALIASNDASKHDPWLMASEIALAQVNEARSRFLKRGSVLVNSENYHPRQITELAGAVATEELLSGNRKRARRSFQTSLTDPTGSAAAQGEWAAPAIGSGLLEEAKLARTLENSEAMAFHSHRMRRFREVAAHCREWSKNDPFSIRPFEFGAAVSGMTQDFDTVIEFAQAGLAIRPDAESLLNSLAFATASKGDTAAAGSALRRIGESDDSIQRLVLIANRGLLAFRTGQIEDGVRLYKKGIADFLKINRPDLAARAQTYLAREAALARHPDAPALLKQAIAEVGKLKDSEEQVILMHVRKIVDGVPLETEKPLSTAPVQGAPVVASQSDHLRVTVSFSTPAVPKL